MKTFFFTIIVAAITWLNTDLAADSLLSSILMPGLLLICLAILVYYLPTWLDDWFGINIVSLFNKLFD